MDKINGATVHRVGNTIFVALPRESWVPVDGGCCCRYCSADGSPKPAFWDLLAISASPSKGRPDTAWMVHGPEYHGASKKAVAS